MLSKQPRQAMRAARAQGRTALKVRAVAAVPKTSAPATGAVKLPSKEVCADLYQDMLLGREFEEMCAQVSGQLTDHLCTTWPAPQRRPEVSEQIQHVIRRCLGLIQWPVR